MIFQNIRAIVMAGVSIFTLHVSAAENTDEALKNLTVQKESAMQMYLSKDYDGAYQIFSDIYLDALNDETVSFYMGLCAYETGHYEMALASFERVEMLNPANMRNQLEIARTQYMLHMYEDARLGFQRVLNNPALPDNVRVNIELFMARIDNQLQKSFFYGTVKAGVIYDSNVNYGSYNDTYTLMDYGLFNGIQPKSDHAYDAQVNFVHLYDIGQKNGYVVRNNLSLFNREYDTMEAYDITYLSYNPALIYQDLKNTYELNFMFDHMDLHHESYLNSYSVMPSLTHKLDQTTNLIGYIKYNQRYFLKSLDDARNADNYEVSLAYQKLWSSSYLMFEGSGERERKLKDNSRVDVDFNRYRFNAEYANQFYPTYSAKFEAELSRRSYCEYSSLFQNRRADTGYKAGLTMTKKITPTLYAEGKVAYERTNSNESVYAYDKQTYNLMLTKSF
jgi:hypothetical protein